MSRELTISYRYGVEGAWWNRYQNIKVGEPVITTDLHRHFIGTGDGTYMELCGIEQIARKFNSGRTYRVGDYVSHSGRFYRCIIPTVGAWNERNWEEKTVADFIEDFKVELEDSYYESTSTSGEVAVAVNSADFRVKDLKISIDQTDDGIRGTNIRVYDRNILSTAKIENKTIRDVSIVRAYDGAILISGSSLSNPSPIVNLTEGIYAYDGGSANVLKKAIPNGTWKLSLGTSEDVGVELRVRCSNTSGTEDVTTIWWTGVVAPLVIDDTYAYNWIEVRLENETYSNTRIFPTLIPIELADDERGADYNYPCNPVVYPISWREEAGNINSGELDVTTGELTVTNGGSTQTIMIAPTEIKTLKDGCVIIADCGDILNCTYNIGNF